MKRITLLVLLTFAFFACQKNEFGKASDTVKELAPDLYCMTVEGDAGFSDFIEKGGASSAEDIASYLSALLSKGPYGKIETKICINGFACSALSVKQAGQSGMLTGRNYDWDECKTMIIKNIPHEGYASLSTVNLDFIGYGDDYTPIGMINGIKAVAGVYVPMDGMNEKGLVVADLMAGDKEVTNQTTDKKDLTTTTAIRLLLNKAANTKEAVKLLEEYDMHSDISTAHHLFISDASGESVCVEWVDSKMIVTSSAVLNNHYLCEQKKGIGSGKLSWEHENILLNAKNSHPEGMSSEDLTDTMFEASVTKEDNKDDYTQWTIIFNQKDLSATWYYRTKKDKSYKFSL